MKEYFYEQDNKTYIIDSKQGIIVDDAKDNTEELLITQNNIEQISEQLKQAKDEKSSRENLKKSNFIKTCVLGGLTLSLVAIIFIIIINLYSGFSIMPLIGICGFSAAIPVLSILTHMDMKQDISAAKMYIDELEVELEKEKEKLKTLKSQSKDKIVESTIIKEVPKSEILNNLKQKKHLIELYVDKRKKYLSSYENGTLDSLLKSSDYSDTDIEFIKFLIESDLKINNKGKVK